MRFWAPICETGLIGASSSISGVGVIGPGYGIISIRELDLLQNIPQLDKAINLLRGTYTLQPFHPSPIFQS
jgi:hypothetical protein